MCPRREERWPDAKKRQPAGGKRDEVGLVEKEGGGANINVKKRGGRRPRNWANDLEHHQIWLNSFGCIVQF
jgi:hypothetical protein